MAKTITTNAILLLILLSTVVLDQLTKAWMLYSDAGVDLWLVQFQLVPNPGIASGMLATASPLLRTLGYVCFFCVVSVVFLYTIFSFLQKKNLFLLQLGLVCFLGGVAGNSLDRISHGFAVDFINLRAGPLHPVFFNLADVALLIGLLLAGYSLFRYSNRIWFLNNMRKSLPVNDRRYQYGFALKLFMINIFSSLSLAAFVYVAIGLYDETLLQNREFSIVMFWGWTALTLVLGVVFFGVGLFYSHKTAGPIYAFSKLVEDLREGKRRDFKLRRGDEHKELEDIAEEILQIYDQNQSE